MLFVAQRVVVDTSVLFEGLTRAGGAPAELIDLWLGGRLGVCFSDAIAYEYWDVLSRKLSPAKWSRIQPILAALLHRGHLVVIRFRWRPSSPDPGDEHIVDCAINGRACVITRNLKDFRLAEVELGLPVKTPEGFLRYLYEASAGAN